MNTISIKLVLVFVLTGALGGCEMMRSTATTPAPPKPVNVCKPTIVTPAPTCESKILEVYTAVDDVLRYYASLKRRPIADLKAELDNARKEFANSGNEASRMKLALLYLYPGSPVRSEEKGLQLLEPYTKSDVNPQSPYRGIVMLVLNSLEESKKSDTNVQALTTKAAEEKKRADDLQRKLDALMDVERTMIQKDQSTRKK